MTTGKAMEPPMTSELNREALEAALDARPFNNSLTVRDMLKQGGASYGTLEAAIAAYLAALPAKAEPTSGLARRLQALAEHLEHQPLAHADSIDRATIREAAAALSALSVSTGQEPVEHICGFPEMGSYTGQVILVAPDWLREKWPQGIGIDACLALEIQNLWKADVQTTGHCCGHGSAPAYISVRPDHSHRMIALDYQPLFHPDGRDDHFIPKTRLASPAPQAVPAQSEGWRPIDTAPKDGTRILLGCFSAPKYRKMEGTVAVAGWSEAGWGPFNPLWWPPTHWMPLPTPPTGKEGA